MKDPKKIKTLLFVLLFFIVWLPYLQELTRFGKEIQLNGAFVPAPKPQLSFDSLRTGAFQQQYEKYENEHFGFRNFLVKLKNSTDYLLFRQLNVDDNIEGRKGMIFSQYAMDRMADVYYNGREKNNATVERIRFMKERLEQQGHHLIVVLAPSKEILYPELLPPAYFGREQKNTDYHDISGALEKDSVPLIDFFPYMKQLRDTSAYPVFPQTGYHWSVYGASYAQDELLRRLKQYIAAPMPEYRQTGIEWSDTARDSDADFEWPQNLLFHIGPAKYPYRKLVMIDSTLQRRRPKVIVIGDSFFQQLIHQKLLTHIFSDDSQFWFYFAKTSYSFSGTNDKPLKDINIMQELNSADLVILWGSMGTLGTFPYGVTDYYYEHTPVTLKDAVLGYLKAQKTAAGAGNNSLPAAEAQRICDNAQHFNLVAANGKFVCADANRKDTLVADRAAAAGWELFSVLQLDKDHIAVASCRNRFLTGGTGNNATVTSTETRISRSETFTMVPCGKGQYAFKAANGNYLSLGERTATFTVSSRAIGRNERFTLVKR